MSKVKVINIATVDELPSRYILLPDDVPAAVERVEKIREKLLKRKLRVFTDVVFRLTTKENTYPAAKKTTRTVKRKPFSQLAFRLERV